MLLSLVHRVCLQISAINLTQVQRAVWQVAASRSHCSSPFKHKWSPINLIFGGLSALALMHMEQFPAWGKPLAGAGNEVDITETAEGFCHCSARPNTSLDHEDSLTAGSPCVWQTWYSHSSHAKTYSAFWDTQWIAHERDVFGHCITVLS